MNHIPQQYGNYNDEHPIMDVQSDNAREERDRDEQDKFEMIENNQSDPRFNKWGVTKSNGNVHVTQEELSRGEYRVCVKCGNVLVIYKDFMCKDCYDDNLDNLK